jgi:hypothetical protein
MMIAFDGVILTGMKEVGGWNMIIATGMHC